MNQAKSALAFLNVHRAKIASLLGVALSYLTVVQQSLTTGDKQGVLVVIAVATWKYLAGNSAYEVTQAQINATK